MPAHAPDPQPVFRALADPTRRAIIEMLSEGPRSIRDVASEFDVSRNAVVKHLSVLVEGGIVEVEVVGRDRMNKLNPEALRTAAQWLQHFDRFWDDRLAALKAAVEKE